MAAKMKELSVEVPTLSGQDFADLLAYLYVSQYFEGTGDTRRGQALVRSKGCLGCHTVRGKGGVGGGDFAKSALVGTSAGLVAGMWNHAGYMETLAEKRQVSWPVVTGKELSDVAAYLGSLQPRPRAPASK